MSTINTRDLPTTAAQIPDGPIDSEPLLRAPYVFPSQAGQLRLLLEQLDGIGLGAYDRRILTWLAGWDWPTVAVVASLLRRARAAGEGGGSGG